MFKNKTHFSKFFLKKISRISDNSALAAPHSGNPEDFASAADQFSGVPEF